jgi:hypothetical protein
MQVGGGVIISSDDPKIALMGIHIYMGGIGLQECFVLLFVGVVFRFQYKMLHPTSKTAAIELTPAVEASSYPFKRHDSADLSPGAWKRVVYPLYASLALITLRIIFRLVEFSSGLHSPITGTEVPFYVLEALPMWVALVLWNVWHPGKILVGPDSEFPTKSRAQKRGEKAEKKAEKALKKEEKAQKKRDKKMDKMLTHQ